MKICSKDVAKGMDNFKVVVAKRNSLYKNANIDQVIDLLGQKYKALTQTTPQNIVQKDVVKKDTTKKDVATDETILKPLPLVDTQKAYKIIIGLETGGKYAVGDLETGYGLVGNQLSAFARHLSKDPMSEKVTGISPSDYKTIANAHGNACRALRKIDYWKSISVDQGTIEEYFKKNPRKYRRKVLKYTLPSGEAIIVKKKDGQWLGYGIDYSKLTGYMKITPDAKVKINRIVSRYITGNVNLSAIAKLKASQDHPELYEKFDATFTDAKKVRKNKPLMALCERMAQRDFYGRINSVVKMVQKYGYDVTQPEAYNIYQLIAIANASGLGRLSRFLKNKQTFSEGHLYYLNRANPAIQKETGMSTKMPANGGLAGFSTKTAAISKRAQMKSLSFPQDYSESIANGTRTFTIRLEDYGLEPGDNIRALTDSGSHFCDLSIEEIKKMTPYKISKDISGPLGLDLEEKFKFSPEVTNFYVIKFYNPQMKFASDNFDEFDDEYEVTRQIKHLSDKMLSVAIKIHNRVIENMANNPEYRENLILDLKDYFKEEYDDSKLERLLGRYIEEYVHNNWEEIKKEWGIKESARLNQINKIAKSLTEDEIEKIIDDLNPDVIIGVSIINDTTLELAVDNDYTNFIDLTDVEKGLGYNVKVYIDRDEVRVRIIEVNDFSPTTIRAAATNINNAFTTSISNQDPVINKIWSRLWHMTVAGYGTKDEQYSFSFSGFPFHMRDKILFPEKSAILSLAEANNISDSNRQQYVENISKVLGYGEVFTNLKVQIKDDEVILHCVPNEDFVTYTDSEQQKRDVIEQKKDFDKDFDKIGIIEDSFYDLLEKTESYYDSFEYGEYTAEPIDKQHPSCLISDVWSDPYGAGGKFFDNQTKLSLIYANRIKKANDYDGAYSFPKNLVTVYIPEYNIDLSEIEYTIEHELFHSGQDDLGTYVRSEENHLLYLLNKSEIDARWSEILFSLRQHGPSSEYNVLISRERERMTSKEKDEFETYLKKLRKKYRNIILQTINEGHNSIDMVYTALNGKFSKKAIEKYFEELEFSGEFDKISRLNQIKKLATQTYRDNKKTYNVDELIKLTKNNKVVEEPISKFKKNLKEDMWEDSDENDISLQDVLDNRSKYKRESVRIKEVTFKYPILVWKGDIVDGNHRLAKAFDEEKETIDVRYITDEQMEKCLYQEIEFPKSEHKDIKKDLKERGYVYTTRVSDEQGKYKKDDLLESTFGDLKVSDIKTYKKLKDHPHFDELTDEMKKDIGKHKYDYIKLKKISRFDLISKVASEVEYIDPERQKENLLSAKTLKFNVGFKKTYIEYLLGGTKKFYENHLDYDPQYTYEIYDDHPHLFLNDVYFDPYGQSTKFYRGDIKLYFIKLNKKYISKLYGDLPRIHYGALYANDRLVVALPDFNNIDFKKLEISIVHELTHSGQIKKPKYISLEDDEAKYMRQEVEIEARWAELLLILRKYGIGEYLSRFKALELTTLPDEKDKERYEQEFQNMVDKYANIILDTINEGHNSSVMVYNALKGKFTLEAVESFFDYLKEKGVLNNASRTNMIKKLANENDSQEYMYDFIEKYITKNNIRCHVSMFKEGFGIELDRNWTHFVDIANILDLFKKGRVIMLGINIDTISKNLNRVKDVVKHSLNNQGQILQKVKNIICKNLKTNQEFENNNVLTAAVFLDSNLLLPARRKILSADEIDKEYNIGFMKSLNDNIKWDKFKDEKILNYLIMIQKQFDDDTFLIRINIITEGNIPKYLSEETQKKNILEQKKKGNKIKLDIDKIKKLFKQSQDIAKLYEKIDDPPELEVFPYLYLKDVLFDPYGTWGRFYDEEVKLYIMPSGRGATYSKKFNAIVVNLSESFDGRIILDEIRSSLEHEILHSAQEESDDKYITPEENHLLYMLQRTEIDARWAQILLALREYGIESGRCEDTIYHEMSRMTDNQKEIFMSQIGRLKKIYANIVLNTINEGHNSIEMVYKALEGKFSKKAIKLYFDYLKEKGMLSNASRINMIKKLAEESKYDKLAKSLKQILNSVGLSGSDIIIGGSGILGALGLKSVGDLDVHVPDEKKWKRVSQHPDGVVDEIRPGNPRVRFDTSDGEIEIFTGPWRVGEEDFIYEDMPIEEIGGIKHWSPEHTLRWKQTMNRPKDKSDIELLEGLKKASRFDLIEKLAGFWNAENLELVDRIYDHHTFFEGDDCVGDINRWIETGDWPWPYEEEEKEEYLKILEHLKKEESGRAEKKSFGLHNQVTVYYGDPYNFSLQVPKGSHNSDNSKPNNVLWTSTLNNGSSAWVDWLYKEDSQGLIFPGNRSAAILSDDGARVFQADHKNSTEKLKKLYGKTDGSIDWDLFSKDYDGICYSPHGSTLSVFDNWDIESTAWFNTGALKFEAIAPIIDDKIDLDNLIKTASRMDKIKKIANSNLIDVEDYDFIIDDKFIKQYSDKKVILLNKNVVEALQKAENDLPENYKFCITYGFRTLEEQTKIVKDTEKDLKKTNPDNWEKLLNKYTGGHEELKLKEEDISDMNHRSGNTVDLKLLDGKNEVDLGDVSEDDSDALDYYENKTSLDKKEKSIKENRRMLKEVLEKHGFENNPDEWWHWGYVGKKKNAMSRFDQIIKMAKDSALYHYAPKEAQEDIEKSGLKTPYSLIDDLSEDFLESYKKRTAITLEKSESDVTAKDVLEGLEKRRETMFDGEGGSRALSAFFSPIPEIKGMNKNIKEFAEEHDLYQIDFNKAVKDGIIEKASIVEEKPRSERPVELEDLIVELGGSEIEDEQWKEKGKFYFSGKAHAMLVLKDGVLPSKYVIKKQLSKKEASERDSYKILYHIGPRPASPKPYKRDIESGWYRKDKYHNNIVFMTDDWIKVWNHHSKRGNVYIYKIPMSLISKTDGINEYDWAPEIKISEDLWKKYKSKIELIGSIDKQKAEEKALSSREGESSFYILPGSREISEEKNMEESLQSLTNSDRIEEVIKFFTDEELINMYNYMMQSDTVRSFIKRKCESMFRNEINKRDIGLTQDVDDNYRTQFDGQLWGDDDEELPSGDSGCITNPRPMTFVPAEEELIERIWAFGELCKCASEEDEDSEEVVGEPVEEPIDPEIKPISHRKIVEYIPDPKPTGMVSSEDFEDVNVDEPTEVVEPKFTKPIEEVQKPKIEVKPVVEEIEEEIEEEVEEEVEEEAEEKGEEEVDEFQKELDAYLDDMDFDDFDDEGEDAIDRPLTLDSMDFSEDIPEYVSEEEIEKRKAYLNRVEEVYGKEYAGYSGLMKTEFALTPVNQPTLGDKREELSDLPDEDDDVYFNKKTLGSRGMIDETFKLGTTWRELGKRVKADPDYISYRLLPMLTLIVGKGVIQKIVNMRYISGDNQTIRLRGVDIPVGDVWNLGTGSRYKGFVQKPTEGMIDFIQKEIPKILKVYLENGAAKPPDAPIMGYLTKALTNNLINHLVREVGMTVLKTRPTCSFCNLKRGEITSEMDYKAGSAKKPLEWIKRGEYKCPRCEAYSDYLEEEIKKAPAEMEKTSAKIDDIKYIMEQARANGNILLFKNRQEELVKQEQELVKQEQELVNLENKRWGANIFAKPSRQHIVCPEDSCDGREKISENGYMPSRVPVSCVDWGNTWFDSIDTNTRKKIEKRLSSFGVSPPAQEADDIQADISTDNLNYRNVFRAPDVLSDVPFKCPFCFTTFTPNSARGRANGWGGLFVRPRVIKWNEPEPVTSVENLENVQPSIETDEGTDPYFTIPEDFIKVLLHELKRQCDDISENIIRIGSTKYPSKNKLKELEIKRKLIEAFISRIKDDLGSPERELYKLKRQSDHINIDITKMRRTKHPSKIKLEELKRKRELIDASISKIEDDLGDQQQTETKFVNSFAKWFFSRKETGAVQNTSELLPVFSEIISSDMDSIIEEFDQIEGNEIAIMKALQKRLGPGLTFGGPRPGASAVLNKIPQFSNVTKAQLKPYFGFVGIPDEKGIIKVPDYIGNQKVGTENLILGGVLFARNIGTERPAKTVSFKPDLFSGEDKPLLDRESIVVYPRKVDVSKFFNFSDSIMNEIEQMREKYIVAGTPIGDHFIKFPKLFSMFVLQQHRNELNIEQFIKVMNEVYTSDKWGEKDKAADAYFRECLNEAKEKYKLPEEEINIIPGKSYVYVYGMFINRQNMNKNYFYNIAGRLGQGTRITEKLYEDANRELANRRENGERDNEWFKEYNETLMLYSKPQLDFSVPKTVKEASLKENKSESSRLQLIKKLAVPSDAKVLQQMNLNELKKTDPPPKDRSKWRDYYSELNEQAKRGPLFEDSLIYTIRDIRTKLTKKQLIRLVTSMNNGLIIFLSLSSNVDSRFIDWVMENIKEDSKYQDYNFIGYIYDVFRTNEENANQILNMNIEDAMNFAIAYHDRELSNTDREGEVEYKAEIIKEYDGMRLVKLTTEEQLNEEGEMMGHCVGSYFEDVKGGLEIYSLRDSRGPHVTFALQGNTIYQIKGKQNLPPVEKYLPVVRQVIMDMNWIPLCGDFQSIDWGGTEKEREYLRPIAEEISKTKMADGKKLSFTFMAQGLHNIYPELGRPYAEQLLENSRATFFGMQLDKIYPDLVPDNLKKEESRFDRINKLASLNY